MKRAKPSSKSKSSVKPRTRAQGSQAQGSQAQGSRARKPKKVDRSDRVEQLAKIPRRTQSLKNFPKQRTEPVQQVSVPKDKYNDPEYIRSMIEGYIEIPVDDYHLIDSGSHIRYFGLDGNFRTGGYVWFKKAANDGREYWMIGQSRNPPKDYNTVKHFILYWDKIGRVWKKIDPEADILSKSIQQRQIDISDIGKFLYAKFGTEFVRFIQAQQQSRTN